MIKNLKMEIANYLQKAADNENVDLLVKYTSILRDGDYVSFDKIETIE